MTTTQGEIPQSNALAEAEPQSIEHLLLQNPFAYADNRLAEQVVDEYQRYRAAYMAAEAAGSKRPSQKKAPQGASGTAASPEELGF